MDREILFRGKRKDNGEWVEGFYFSMEHDDGRHIHHFIIPLGADLSLSTPIEKIQVEVNHETVCQYIGVEDINGKKIFENDIIKREVLFDNYVIGQVIWFDIGYDGFYLKYENSCYPMGKSEQTGKSEDEVIGNIFDNPELLRKIESAD